MTGPKAADPAVYPLLRSSFDSVSAPDLYVVGAAAHGMDRYRYKASGGFIHGRSTAPVPDFRAQLPPALSLAARTCCPVLRGFRFNARALWRVLEERYELRVPLGDVAELDGTACICVMPYDWDPAGAAPAAAPPPAVPHPLPPLWDV
eukprot:gene22305-biopygen69751